MSASFMIDLVAAAAAAAMPQAADCRQIVDPAARLACYDSREAPGTVPAPARQPEARPSVPTYTPPASPSVSAAPAPAYSPPPAARAAQGSTKALVGNDPTGRVASVTQLRYGLNRITLDDGRAFDTTVNLEAPPAIGTDVRLRRTPLGTTFMDAPGRNPITVRSARR